MDCVLKLKRLRNNNGVRTCMIVNASNGLPLVYENLYVAVLSRTKNYSYSTIESIAGVLMSYAKYLNDKGITLDSKVNKERLLEGRLAYDTMIHFSSKHKEAKVTKIKEERIISECSLHYKISVIEKYLVWFFLNVIETNNKDAELISRNFEYVRPNIKVRKSYSELENKSLDKDQIKALKELIKIDSESNPFKDCVKFRNEVIISILLETGIRGGELLNLKTDDFKYNKKELHIIRRPDDKEETRLRQPLVKTAERKIPLTKALCERIKIYIDKERSNQKLSKGHNYLMVTHSSNFVMGSPLTISGYQKIFNIIRMNEALLKNFVAHSLRHTWNVNYSEHVYQLANPANYEMYEKVRNYLMGWSRRSKTSEVYTQRYLINESYKIMQFMNATSLLEKEPKKHAQNITKTRKSIFGF